MQYSFFRHFFLTFVSSFICYINDFYVWPTQQAIWSAMYNSKCFYFQPCLLSNRIIVNCFILECLDRFSSFFFLDFHRTFSNCSFNIKIMSFVLCCMPLIGYDTSVRLQYLQSRKFSWENIYTCFFYFTRMRKHYITT